MWIAATVDSASATPAYLLIVLHPLCVLPLLWPEIDFPADACHLACHGPCMAAGPLRSDGPRRRANGIGRVGPGVAAQGPL